MNVHAATISDTEEAWDERTLGADEKFVEVVDQAEEELINEAAGTQLISIRMSKCMIDDFKMIASLNGSIGYQTLMKQILQRFVDSEKKRILRELVSEKLKEQEPKSKAAAATTEPPKRKAQQKKAA
jgi:uncharacterized protein (DUF4415 family)